MASVAGVDRDAAHHRTSHRSSTQWCLPYSTNAPLPYACPSVPGGSCPPPCAGTAWSAPAHGARPPGPPETPPARPTLGRSTWIRVSNMTESTQPHISTSVRKSPFLYIHQADPVHLPLATFQQEHWMLQAYCTRSKADAVEAFMDIHVHENGIHVLYAYIHMHTYVHTCSELMDPPPALWPLPHAYPSSPNSRFCHLSQCLMHALQGLDVSLFHSSPVLQVLH